MGSRVPRLRRIRERVTAPFRRARARPAGLGPGRATIDLSFTEILPDPDLPAAIDDLRAGRIPEGSLSPIHAKVNTRAPWVFVAWTFFGIDAVAGGLGATEGGFPTGLAATAAALFAIAMLVTRSWLLPRRDVRDRRIRIEEGEVTEKRVDLVPANGSEQARLRRRAGFWSAVRAEVARGGEGTPPDGTRTRRRVRIGGRVHEVPSPSLFEALGTGVRYRLYLSRESGHLVAVEPADLEEPRGYRRPPRAAAPPAEGG